MEYSDIITFTEEGFRVPEKLLHPVGVYDGSRCWGAFITNLGQKKCNREPKKPNHQILLSPIPFSSWACTVRIRARINDKPGMLMRFIDALYKKSDEENLYINIISISENTTGYYSGSINMLVELSDLRKEAKDLRKKIKYNEDIKNNITSYAFKVFKRILSIEKAIININAHTNSNRQFLYHVGDCEGGNYLWDNEILKDKIKEDCDKNNALHRIIDSHKVHNLHCKWLRTQAMCYLYSEEENPLRFDYSLSEKILKIPLNTGYSIKNIEKHLDLDVPTIFLGTFNPVSRYIRLIPLQDDESHKPLIKISYTYNCISLNDEEDISKNGSNNLLQYLTRNLPKEDEQETQAETQAKTQTSLTRKKSNISFDIRNVISYSKRFSRKDEEGVIQIWGFLNGYKYKNLNDVSNYITSCINRFNEYDPKRNVQFNEQINVTTQSPKKSDILL